MSLTDLARPVLAWLATYLVHSTLLLSGAWLITRRLRSVRVRELVWRAALFGGVLTAGAQLATDLTPLAGIIEFGGDAGSAIAVTEVAPGPAPLPLAEPAVPTPAAPLTWSHWALSVWIGASALTLLLLGLALGRLRLLLSGRTRVEGGPLRAALDDVLASGPAPFGIRLFTSSKIDSPLALGVLSPTIVVPARAETELAPDLLRAMLAHEIGHLARRDPLWLDLARLVETLLCVQPLNRLARRELSTCSELLCDAWAVDRTGDRIALARCLTEVAGWLVQRRAPLPACGMASPRSPLRARIENILEGPGESDRGLEPAAPLAVLAVGLVAWTAPGFAAPLPPPDWETHTGGTIDFASESPAADSTAELLVQALAPLAQSLELLRAELAQVESQLAGRSVPADLRERLDAAREGVLRLNLRHQQIQTLLASW